MFRRQSKLEKAVAATPVTPWLLTVAASIVSSAVLFAKGKKELGIFVGLWAPTLMNASMYNRLLKAV